MLVKCLIIALIYTLGNMDVRMGGAHRWNWPIFLCAIVGWAAGDLKTGIILGVELQLIFLGFVNIGMSVMPDAAAGSTLAVAFVIMSGLDTAAAIALAMPIALLFQPLGVVKNVILNYFNVKGDTYAEKADYKGLEMCLHGGNLVAALFDFVPMFLALYAGSAAVESIVNVIPAVVMACLNKTAQILPALGMAYLMSYVLDKKTLPFCILGFALAAYLGLGALAISIFGGVIALVYFNTKTEAAENAESEEY